MFEFFVEKLQDAPDTIYNEIVDMAKTIQKKMREYSDATSGRMDPEYVMLVKPHMEFLNKLRLKEPNKYKDLVYFASIYGTLDIDVQPKALASFMESIGF